MAWTPSWPQISPTKPSACEAGNEGHGGEGGVRAALPSSTKPRPFDGDEDAARSSLSSTTSCRRCSSQRQLPAASAASQRTLKCDTGSKNWSVPAGRSMYAWPRASTSLRRVHLPPTEKYVNEKHPGASSHRAWQ